MSDIPQSPEAVAYELMTNIFKSEGKGMFVPAKNSETKTVTTTRKEIIDTYKECLDAVKHPS